MLQKYFYLWITILFLLFYGCGSKEVAKPETTTIPDWYLQPAKYIPANLLYGAGTGASPEGAKKRALQNMSYNLQLQVQASSTNRSLSKRDGSKVTTSSSLTEEIKLRSKKINFPNVQDRKVEQIGNQYYAVLVTEYADLIADNRKKLSKNIPLLEDALQELPSQSALEKVVILTSAQDSFLTASDSLENLEILALVYRASGISSAYLKGQFEFLRNYSKREKNAKRSIIFQVSGSNQWQTAKKVVATNLQKQDYKTGANYNAIIRVSGTEELTSLFEGKIKQSKIALLIELQGLDRRIFKSKSFSLKATSLKSAGEASRKSQNSLAEEIQEGIFKVLGL